MRNRFMLAALAGLAVLLVFAAPATAGVKWHGSAAAASATGKGKPPKPTPTPTPTPTPAPVHAVLSVCLADIVGEKPALSVFVNNYPTDAVNTASITVGGVVVADNVPFGASYSSGTETTAGTTYAVTVKSSADPTGAKGLTFSTSGTVASCGDSGTPLAPEYASQVHTADTVWVTYKAFPAGCSGFDTYVDGALVDAGRHSLGYLTFPLAGSTHSVRVLLSCTDGQRVALDQSWS